MFKKLLTLFLLICLVVTGHAQEFTNVQKAIVQTNYMTNGGFEKGRAGWGTYNDSDTATMTIASPAVVTVTSTTGYYVGMPFSFTTTGALPIGVSASTTYYVSSVVSGTTFQFSATVGGAAINTSGTQSGTHTFRPGVPIDGTGGTSSILTATNSSPLKGSYSGLISRSTNNEGEGINYPFTIDPADTRKVLRIDLDYEIASGTYTDDEIQWWIYDVTNGTLIQPAPFKLKNSTVKESIQMEFQSTGSTSYRLLGHIASPSTTPSVVKVDNFSTGKVAKAYGSPISDWKAYTPTITNTTNASATGYYRQVGDSVELDVTISWTGAATTSAPKFSLPSGLSLDTAKLSSTQAYKVAGVGQYLNSGSTNYPLFIATDTTTVLQVVPVGNGATNDLVSVLLSTPKSGDKLNLTARVPILGWSSSVQSSSEADTRVVAASYERSSGVQSVSSGVATVLNFSTRNYDTHNLVSVGSSDAAQDFKVTAQSPGYYKITIGVELDTTTNVTGLNVGYKKNGGSIVYIASINGAQAFVQGEVTLNLNAGDYIQPVVLYAASTGSRTVYNSNKSSIFIEKVLGPSQIAASETVAASYWVSANFAASNTTPINFDSKEFDTHGMCVPSATAFKCTAQISGTYSVGTYVYAGAVSDSFYIYKNGTAYKPISSQVPGLNSSGTTLIKLIAGDYIDIRPTAARTITGATLNNANASTVFIQRTGN